MLFMFYLLCLKRIHFLKPLVIKPCAASCNYFFTRAPCLLECLRKSAQTFIAIVQRNKRIALIVLFAVVQDMLPRRGRNEEQW